MLQYVPPVTRPAVAMIEARGRAMDLVREANQMAIVLLNAL